MMKSDHACPSCKELEERVHLLEKIYNWALIDNKNMSKHLSDLNAAHVKTLKQVRGLRKDRDDFRRHMDELAAGNTSESPKCSTVSFPALPIDSEAEKVVDDMLAKARNKRVYRKDGDHITLGIPAPLSPDFVPTAMSQTELERLAKEIADNPEIKAEIKRRQAPYNTPVTREVLDTLVGENRKRCTCENCNDVDDCEKCL